MEVEKTGSPLDCLDVTWEEKAPDREIDPDWWADGLGAVAWRSEQYNGAASETEYVYEDSVNYGVWGAAQKHA